MQGIYIPLKPLNRSPLLNPVTPDLKVGIFHLTAGSRKELRFVLNRSFHVQLSVWPIAIVKVNVFVQNLFQLLRCFVKMMVEGFFFLMCEKRTRIPSCHRDCPVWKRIVLPADPVNADEKHRRYIALPGHYGISDFLVFGNETHLQRSRGLSSCQWYQRSDMKEPFWKTDPGSRKHNSIVRQPSHR